MFVTTLRDLFNDTPFTGMDHQPEFDMLGRTYAIGYEPDLEEVLFERPRGRILDPELLWAVWYPLQRSKSFYRLSDERQREILAEHGGIGRRYGEAGLAADIRLACHGLDRNDNDFVIGLVGRQLHPLSALVREMRATEQTSQYLDRLGPFFVGHVVWAIAPFGMTDAGFDDDARDYDAVLVVSFGGPEGPDEVMPFLDHVPCRQAGPDAGQGT